jgi:hypothetical protein
MPMFLFLHLKNVCSLKVALTFDHIDHSNFEPVAFGSDIVEGVKCESHVKKPLLKSCFWILIKKKMENVN